MNQLWCVRVGLTSYDEARELQKRLQAARQAGVVPDVLLLLEHSPVYTKGRRAQPGELAMGEDWYRVQGIEVTDTDRGGAVTYHGPGQLVGYPIVSLKAYGDDVRDYIARMERVMIASLEEVGVGAQLLDGLTGVWTDGPPPSADPAPDAARKIGSIGVHISRGITTHGFAINVNNDLQPFEWIVPCGIEGCQMTSVCRELGAEFEMDGFIGVVANHFGEIYDRELIEVGVEALAERVEGPAPVR